MNANAMDLRALARHVMPALALLALVGSLDLRAAPIDGPAASTAAASEDKPIPSGGPKVRLRRESTSTISRGSGRKGR